MMMTDNLTEILERAEWGNNFLTFLGMTLHHFQFFRSQLVRF